jgi:hypothetical protein
MQMLTRSSGVDGPVETAAYTSAIARRFQFNDQEVALMASVTSAFAKAVQSLKAAQAALISGKTAFSASDFAQQQDLIVQRDQEVVALANQLLDNVRPQTAGYIRATCGLRDSRQGVPK